MKFKVSLFSGLFFCISLLSAQVDRIFGVHWVNMKVVSALVNPNTDVLTDLDTLDGVSSIYFSTASLDRVKGHYFLRTNLGVTIVDIYTGSVINSIPITYNFITGFRYHENTNSLYAFRSSTQSSSLTLVRLDLATQTFSDVAVMTDITSLTSQPCFTIDQENDVFYTMTNIGLTGIDINTGLITDSISNGADFSAINYDPVSSSIYGMRKVGSSFNFSNFDLDLEQYDDLGTPGGFMPIVHEVTAMDTINDRYLVQAGGGLRIVDNTTGTVLSTLATCLGFKEFVYLEDYVYLSLVNNSPINEYVVYPNPSKDFVNIVLDKDYADIKLQLWDMQGKMIYSTDFSETSKVNLDLQFLVDGTYFIHVLADGKNGRVKFVKY